ncbi:hypothetical protein TrVE_jg5858 [Triparma verrucosa]|uniref:Phenylalanine--tRNA ligase alpha subunit n=1 Tax=Triparma verrucosa TaxID=1606542 RepID=A0A9W7F1Y2_9STRA|nr:hypothetical protein TrVE_jg5858 [Triparma verrucosa]
MISTTLMNIFVLTALLSLFISSTTSFIVPHTTRVRAVARAVIRSNVPLQQPLQPLAASDTSNADVDVETLESVLMKVNSMGAVGMSKVESASTSEEVERVRLDYLGKKGQITKVMSLMRTLNADDKKALGAAVNEVKQKMEDVLSTKKDAVVNEELLAEMESERVDVTMPGIASRGVGHRHPLSMIIERATDTFVKLGYDTVTELEDSPEIESDYYCFEALNCPPDHPARDMQDSFYLTDPDGPEETYMLRTHTSAVQIHQMEKRKPPFRIVAPGRVYRRDDIDATHSMIFHQIEILAIEEKGKLTLGDLKGTVEYFLKQMFGPTIEVRFRGSFFPFTEPSMEVDVKFKGKWLEVLGCGMVDPRVLEKAGIDPEKFGGFAAGFGAERFAMVIHGISDIREFYNGDNRFLEQFPHFGDQGITAFLEGRVAEKKEENAAGAEEKQKKKKAEGGSAAQAAPASAEIDISKLDIRVGTVVKAWKHEEAEKLYCEEIDIGEDEPRLICSGLRNHMGLEELEGKRVLVLANLKARKMVGVPSHGMVLCAFTDDDSEVKLVEPAEGAPNGARVTVEGFEGEPATENQILKKKMLDKIMPKLKVNGDGVVAWDGVPLATEQGVVKSTMPGCSVG